MTNLKKLMEVKRTAKVIYMTSGLKEMMVYLDGKVNYEDISEDECDKMINMITEECSHFTTVEREKFWNIISMI